MVKAKQGSGTKIWTGLFEFISEDSSGNLINAYDRKFLLYRFSYKNIDSISHKVVTLLDLLQF